MFSLVCIVGVGMGWGSDVRLTRLCGVGLHLLHLLA